MRKLYRGALLTIMLLSVSPPAWAQIKPKIMIIFDTSFWMNTDTAYYLQEGDGSELCNGKGQVSRIYQLKVGLSEALQGMGTKEIDFALATFPMKTDPTLEPKCFNYCLPFGTPKAYYCTSGHYYNVPEQDNEKDVNYPSGCKISTHDPLFDTDARCSDPANPCKNWYDQYKEEVLKVPFGDPVENIMLYLDQKEDTDSVAPLQNPEVRAALGWNTPLGKSFFYAYGYFDKEVSLPVTDYRKSCERLYITLFTAGSERCNPEASDPFHPIHWVRNLYTNSKFRVITHTVAIATDNFASSVLQVLPKEGGGEYYPVDATNAAIKKAFMEIVAKAQPPTESCNNQDDDCDGAVDEDFPLKGQLCTNGRKGVCLQEGTYICSGDGTGVVCSAPTNINGSPEICDGLDNDCDGEVDEDFPDCKVQCQPEICNGKDDDCDTVPDNDIAALPCGSEVGRCKKGVTQCVSGKIVCQGGIERVEETCNGEDDDCDGIRDSFSEPCYTFSAGCDVTQGICQGICRIGARSCTATYNGSSWQGSWGKCTGEVGPQQEICDGLDNNCNNSIDEQAPCPGTSQCLNGQCTQPCGEGEFACPTGLICKNDWCVPDLCDPEECAQKGSGWVCRAGECVDPCKYLTCGKYERCNLGVCEDLSCYSQGCPNGQKCVQGQCQKDPCQGVVCGTHEFCQDGQCLRLCAATYCELGEKCEIVEDQGTRFSLCIKDPCYGVTCGLGETCHNGKCDTDPCSRVTCEKGESCNEGVCVQNWCEVTRCPPGYICNLGNCIFGEKSETLELLAAGGGGCTCQIDPVNKNNIVSILIIVSGIVIALLRSIRRDC